MNNLGSRDQFKTIRIGEKLVANYKVESFSQQTNTIASHDQFKPIRIGEIWRRTVMAASVRGGQPTKL